MVNARICQYLKSSSFTAAYRQKGAETYSTLGPHEHQGAAGDLFYPSRGAHTFLVKNWRSIDIRNKKLRQPYFSYVSYANLK